ncbi:MAG: glycosyltransferase [Gammaproteobacteria bacterium]|nr:glycosyltransferase [Gammaproteobacteria bacterium]
MTISTPSADRPQRVAYLINHYPKVSHTFIRREIQALEAAGVEVFRFALRGWDDDLVDPEDHRERERTHYLLRSGVVSLLFQTFRFMLSRPLAALRAFFLALKMVRGAERSLPYHLAYFLEACALANQMTSIGVQHVHAHFGTNPAEVAMLASVVAGATFSFTAHGSDEVDRPYLLGLPEKLARARFVMAVSFFGRSQLFRLMPASEWHKVHVVRCGLGADFLEAPYVDIPSTNRLVCVGRLCEQKGQFLLIEAVRMLADRDVSCEIVLAGDGELRTQIEQRIRELGVQDRFRITGWISSDQVKDEIMQARALVLPSFAEGLPVVIMEAFALGRPVISTYIGGIPELVENGRSGWLVPAGSAEALAAALEHCLRSTPQELQALGEQGKMRVQQAHDASANARRILALLQEAGSLDARVSKA